MAEKVMRAKMRIGSIKLSQGCECLEFWAVSSGSAEDNTYATATPSAKLEMTINNTALHGKFKPGQAFYVDFTPAE